MTTTGIETRTRKGRTVYRVRIRRPRSVSAQFDSIEEAALWRHAALKAISEGREPPAAAAVQRQPDPAPESRPTIETAADDLIRGIRHGRIRTRQGTSYKDSGERYESVLRVHVLDRIGGAYVDELGTADIQDVINEIAIEASAETAKKSLDALSVIYRELVRRRIVPISPCPGVTVPRDPSSVKPIRVITLEEADRIVAAAEALDAACGRSRTAPILSLAFSTGMRAGELLALRWGPDSLDIERGHITIGPRGNLSRRRPKGGTFPLVYPKTHASVRDFALLASEIPRLLRHFLATGRPSAGSFVFADDQGNPLCGATVLYRDWRRVIDRAGIEDPRPRLHDARHHWAIMALRANGHDAAGQQVIAKEGGWGSTKMLLDRYGRHVLPGESQTLAAKIEAYRASQRSEAV